MDSWVVFPPLSSHDLPSKWVCVLISSSGKDPGNTGLDFTLMAHCMCAKALQSCLTLWDPMDCSLAGSSVDGILQAEILEWVAMPSSRGPSWSKDSTLVSCVSYPGRIAAWTAGGTHLNSVTPLKNFSSNTVILWGSECGVKRVKTSTWQLYRHTVPSMMMA